MARVIDPSEVSKRYQESIRQEVAGLPGALRIVGLLANDDEAARTYAEYTRRGCERVGIGFELREVRRLKLEAEIERINADPGVHGVLVYYPIFGVERDNTLKELVDPTKDIEGLSSHWIRRLYANDRTDGQGRKSILPCTPLAVVKLLEAAGAGDQRARKPLAGRTVTVFNRSEVVGRPLAAMLANDGARVYSFDEYGPLEFTPDDVEETDVTRAEAIAASRVVVTGVPSRAFPPVDAGELAPGTICLNFSTIRNFTDAAREAAEVFVPRVGPMTVTMVLRNATRLYRDHHAGGAT
jgi:methylenetetrahydrofolate dehydrogenase (NADP+)/methenyltetrahydrofolate cyclohydrolase